MNTEKREQSWLERGEESKRLTTEERERRELEESRRRSLGDLEKMYEMVIHETRMKYVNVLLVAAAACIGFAVTQTKNEQLSCWLLPWAGALLSWAYSFFVGCAYIFQRSELFNINQRKILVETGKDSQAKSSALIKYALAFDLDQQDEKAKQKLAVFLKRQLLCLVSGAILYIIWHVLEMWRRTEEYTCLLWY